MTYLENNNILKTEQYGFRKNRSAINALKSVEDYIDVIIRNKQVVCMISLDIKNAFSNIRRNSILAIMDKYNVPNKLKFIIFDYLKSRKFFIIETDTMEYNI